MPSACILSGLIFIALAFIASAISLVAPYWYVETSGIRNTGLWALCTRGECTWFFENEFQWEKQQEEWWYAVQGLYILGVLSLLLAFFMACCQLCCTCCKGGLSMINITTGLLFLAFLELATAIALFGAKAAMTREVGANMDGSDKRYFSWAFWVGCSSVGLSLLSSMFYMIEVCRSGSHRGYTRGEVV